MAEKKIPLSIVIRAVDRATAAVRAIKERFAGLATAINARMSKLTAPFRAFGASVSKALGERFSRIAVPLRALRASLANLGAELGIPKLLAGFKGVGGAIAGVASRALPRLAEGFKVVGGVVGGLLGKIPLLGGLIGGVVAGSVAALMSMVNHFDELGDKAESIGVGVDFLAQMRDAAERSGSSLEQLDGGLQGFTKSLGQARAGTGRMAAFLNKVSPALLRQLKAAKSNEQAIDLLADAMAKLEDPAKRAALAQATLGNAELAPLFARGSAEIQKLRDHYAKLAGSQEQAVSESGKVDEAMKDLKASTDGIKAALVTGLAPALAIVVKQLSAWFVDHREDIAEWAKGLGEKLPGALQKVVGFLREAVAWMKEAAAAVKTIIDGVQSFAGSSLTPEELRSRLEAGQARRRSLSDLIGDVNRIRSSFDARPEATAQTRGAAAAFATTRSSTDAKVTVDFANAPKGTRVRSEGTADISTNVGYQMEFAP